MKTNVTAAVTLLILVKSGFWWNQDSKLVRCSKHYIMNKVLLVSFGIELGVLLHVSGPLFDTKLSHFQNSGDSPHRRWNIQWCLGFSSSPTRILQLVRRCPLRAPPVVVEAPFCRGWTFSLGSGPMGTIYNANPSLRGSIRSPALFYQVLTERFLKMEQPCAPHTGDLTELFIKEGVRFTPLTAQSTQSRGRARRLLTAQPPWRIFLSMWHIQSLAY